MHEKQYTRDASARQGATHFPQSFTKRAAQRHSDRPPNLEGGKIESYSPTIIIRQAPQPVPNRFNA